jgi:hypothetical protein
MPLRRINPNGPDVHPKKVYSVSDMTNDGKPETTVAFSIENYACERTQPTS